MTRLEAIKDRLAAYKHWKEKSGESLDETHAPDMDWLINRVESQMEIIQRCKDISEGFQEPPKNSWREELLRNINELCTKALK